MGHLLLPFRPRTAALLRQGRRVCQRPRRRQPTTTLAEAVDVIARKRALVIIRFKSRQLMALLQLLEQDTVLLPAMKGDIITKPTTKETLVSSNFLFDYLFLKALLYLCFVLGGDRGERQPYGFGGRGRGRPRGMSE
jgi:hypothetical protein